MERSSLFPADTPGRRIARWFLVLLYVVAGSQHVLNPGLFLPIVPGWVAWPITMIFWTGIAEIAGALALGQSLSPGLRRASAAALALYALCVWPANANHMLIDLARRDGGWGWGYHVPRMALQPVLIWLALWSGGATDWPRRRPKGG